MPLPTILKYSIHTILGGRVVFPFSLSRQPKVLRTFYASQSLGQAYASRKEEKNRQTERYRLVIDSDLQIVNATLES